METCSDAAQLLTQLPPFSSKKVWREANFADSFAKPIKSGKCQGSHFPMIGESCEIVVGEIPLFAGGITQSAPPFFPSFSSSKGGGSSWLFPTKLFPSIIFLLPLPFFLAETTFVFGVHAFLLWYYYGTILPLLDDTNGLSKTTALGSKSVFVETKVLEL